VPSLPPNAPLSGRITASEISSTAKAFSTVSIGKEDVMLQEELASLGLDLSAKADPKKIVSTLEKARLELKATYDKTVSRLIELEKKYVPEHAEKKKKAAAKKAAAANEKTTGKKSLTKTTAKKKKKKGSQGKSKGKSKRKRLQRKAKGRAMEYVSLSPFNRYTFHLILMHGLQH